MRRWLAAHGVQYAGLKPVYLGDDLFSPQSICQAVLDASAHFLFVCKPDSHPAIEEFRTGIKLDELIRKVRRGKKWTTYRYQWLCDVPLRGDAKAIIVNWLMIETLDADRNVTYRNGFITDLPVNRDNVAVLAACGRARWKAENESNRGKTPGAAATSDIGSGSADRPPLGRLVQSKVVWHRLSGSLW